MPLKVYTKDGVLIGEFGEIKRRSTGFEKIPKDIKNAFIFYSLLNSFNSIDPNEISEGFSKAKPFIRRRLGARLSIKRIPDLKFLPEDGIKN